MIKRLRAISHAIDQTCAQFGRGADKWLEAPLPVFAPYVLAVAFGAAHFFRLVVRGAEVHGERTGYETGRKVGQAEGTKLGRLIQYLESCALNGWSLNDDVFAEILRVRDEGLWPGQLDIRWPGLVDEPLDCSYFVRRHRPDMTPDDAVDEPADVGQAAAHAETSRHARRALKLGDDPFAQYRKTVLRPVPGEDELNDILHGEATLQVVDESSGDDVVDAELVDEGQADETAPV